MRKFFVITLLITTLVGCKKQSTPTLTVNDFNKTGVLHNKYMDNVKSLTDAGLQYDFQDSMEFINYVNTINLNYTN